MHKQIKDMTVSQVHHLTDAYSLLILTPADGSAVAACLPGQFVQVAVPSSPATFLRRPISINRVIPEKRELHLLIRRAGEGTAHLIASRPGDTINIIYPLGNGFTLPDRPLVHRPLLVGGGVGVAPLLELGVQLRTMGVEPEFLLGARSERDLLLLDEFSRVGKVHVSTDDGSAGHPGLVIANPALAEPRDMIYCCGPAPMMKAVAAIARGRGIECEVSLENMMACGLGACLCCVENTVKGNVCVCTEGPVFNINQLNW